MDDYAQQIPRHATFVELLRELDGEPVRIETLAGAFTGRLRAPKVWQDFVNVEDKNGRTHTLWIGALIGWSRDPHGYK